MYAQYTIKHIWWPLGRQENENKVRHTDRPTKSIGKLRAREKKTHTVETIGNCRPNVHSKSWTFSIFFCRAPFHSSRMEIPKREKYNHLLRTSYSNFVHFEMKLANADQHHHSFAYGETFWLPLFFCYFSSDVQSIWSFGNSTSQSRRFALNSCKNTNRIILYICLLRMSNMWSTLLRHCPIL